MATSLTRSSSANGPAPARAVTVRRIRLAAEAAPGTKVRRRFTQPRPLVATEEAVESAALAATKPWPEPTDRCDVVFVPGAASADLPSHVADWLATPADQPEAVPAVVVAGKEETVRWRPGQVVVQARAERLETVLAAITDFAFYEGELRALEEAVASHEAQARDDAGRVHSVRRAGRKERARFAALIAYFSELRLTYARLEPCLAAGGSRTLPADARRLMARLLRKADVEARLEAVSNRLEALEDLYEGGNDRVADYRWYRNGHLLEIGILVMLVFEAALMVADICIHYREYQQEARMAAAEERSAAADLSTEFKATLTRVGDDQITFKRTPDGAEETLPPAANLKVSRAKVDRDTQEVDTGAPIPGGLRNEVFGKMGDKGVPVTIVTDPTNKKIAEILVMPKRGR